MLTGKRVLLRPMQHEDIAIQHIFDQDLELYGLDSAVPRISPLERTHAFYTTRTTFDDTIAPFAIEADGTYIGHCALRDIQNRYGNLELGITK